MSNNFLTNIFPFKKDSVSKKSVAITGSSGLIGSALVIALSTRYQINCVSTKDGKFDPQAFDGVDAVINLAGENIASGDGLLAILGRWSAEKKKKILDSRVEGTQLVVNTISKLKTKPKVMISASAVGYYGYSDFETTFDESSTRGAGFLADVCEQWEAETLKVKALGVRPVCLRFGVVLSPLGGVVKKLLPIFQLGGGGTLGSGKQPFSWVSLRDVVRAVVFALETPSIVGAVNVCAPAADSNADFTDAFGRCLGRPTILPVPEIAAKLVFGQMGEEVLLGGQKVSPTKLLKAGFEFEDTSIFTAMPSIMSSE